MPFIDTNSHLTTKPYNLYIKFHSNSESYDQHYDMGPSLGVVRIFYLRLEVFSTIESTLRLTARTFSYVISNLMNSQLDNLNHLVIRAIFGFLRIRTTLSQSKVALFSQQSCSKFPELLNQEPTCRTIGTTLLEI